MKFKNSYKSTPGVYGRPVDLERDLREVMTDAVINANRRGLTVSELRLLLDELTSAGVPDSALHASSDTTLGMLKGTIDSAMAAGLPSSTPALSQRGDGSLGLTAGISFNGGSLVIMGLFRSPPVVMEWESMPTFSGLMRARGDQAAEAMTQEVQS